MALLNDAPRAANVVAVGNIKVAMLDRNSFIRLLGPCEEILARNMKNYAHYEQASYENKLAALKGNGITFLLYFCLQLDEDLLDAPRQPSSAPVGAYRRRTAVSSEPVSAMSVGNEAPMVTYPKSEEQIARIMSSIKNNFLFVSLDDEQKKIIVNTMKEMSFAVGDSIIKQGDTGDFFYVLDSGTCECFVRKEAAEPLLVKTYDHGESFGELALMYNCPRAATVIAKTAVVVWAMERLVFRRVLMETTASKRSLYESFLGILF